MEDIHKFRSSYTTIFEYCLKLSLIAGTLLFFAIFAKESFKFDMMILKAVLIFELVIILMTLLIGFLSNRLYKVEVKEDGISSPNPQRYPKKDFLKWSEMKTTEKVNFWGFKYILIGSQNFKKILWIPLELNHKETFIRLLESKTNIDESDLKWN